MPLTSIICSFIRYIIVYNFEEALQKLNDEDHDMLWVVHNCLSAHSEVSFKADRLLCGIWMQTYSFQFNKDFSSHAAELYGQKCLLKILSLKFSCALHYLLRPFNFLQKISLHFGPSFSYKVNFKKN